MSPPPPPHTPSVGAVLVLENLYPSIQCIWRAKHPYLYSKGEENTTLISCFPPVVPTHQTPLAHGTNPRERTLVGAKVYKQTSLHSMLNLSPSPLLYL